MSKAAGVLEQLDGWHQNTVLAIPVLWLMVAILLVLVVVVAVLAVAVLRIARARSEPVVTGGANTPRVEENNHWYRYNDSGAVLVFVHGLLSNSQLCWRHQDKKRPEKSSYWPGIIESDSRFNNIAIYLAGYHSEIDAGDFPIEQCAEQVFTYMRVAHPDGHPPVMTSKKIIFVCHSMGGIVVRHLLCVKAREFKDKQVGIVLIASPSYGSTLASTLDFALSLYNLKQGKQLRWGSDLLKALDERFRNLMQSGDIPALSGLELFETKFLLHWKYLPFFTRTKVVTAEAAARYFPNPKQVGGADHASICKPTSRADLVHQYLYDFLYDSALLPGGRTRAEVAGPAGIGRAPAGDERPAARPDRPAVVPEIFVSFASGDDNALSTDLPGWVTQFQRCLTLQLAKSDGRFGAVKISAADSLRPDRIPRESVFLAVISTRYLADAGCRSQLTAFGRRADEQAERPYGDGRSRIFSVLLEDIPPAAWPVECKGTTESNFHGRAASSASAAPVSPTDETFAERLRMLGLAISRELSALRTEGVRDGAEGTAIAPAKPVVFVADTSDSLKAVRQRLVNELGEREVEVISSVPPPFPASDHEAEVTRCLRSAALSVHLLDEFAGREIQGDPGDTYPAKQARLALEHAPAQFVWVPSSLDKVDDERQREFLDSLARRQRVGERFAFVRQSPTTVSREVLSMLSSLRVIEGRRPRLGALLDTHIKDHLHAFALGQFLVGHNIATYVNPEEDDPGRSMNLLERRLREVNRLVIVFGAAGEKWVRARLANAIQIAITQKFSLAACGIYFAPPHTTKDGRFRGELLPIHEFDASDLAREDGLAPLLATV